MTARLYKAPAQYRGYVDEYSLYLPYPKCLRNENRNGVTGIYLGCSPASDGTMIRCNWEEWNLKHGLCDCLGRKVEIDAMPEAFRNECRRIERLFNEACKLRDFTRFDREA